MITQVRMDFDALQSARVTVSTLLPAPDIPGAKGIRRVDEVMFTNRAQAQAYHDDLIAKMRRP